MKQTIYKGELTGRDAWTGACTLWRAEIWHYYETEPEEAVAPGVLTFDGDEPIVIDWEEKAKEEPVVGSTCTLNIISPGDRSYVDMYTIEAGAIGLTIYRDGQLYWTGTLDPEFYEEPYERAAGYTVQLTFTDFGILDRLKYNGAGMRSIADIINECATRCRLMPELWIDESFMSLRRSLKDGEKVTVGVLPGQMPNVKDTPVGLAEIFVRSDNFYDEDGEAQTLEDVLAGVLQPLALRIVQHEGRLYVYDLNGLYLLAPRRSVFWSGESQTLGVDAVKNNVKITWSPYAAVDEMLPDTCWPEDVETDSNVVNLDNVEALEVGDSDVYTYHLTQDLEVWGEKPATESAGAVKGRYHADKTDAGFSLWLRDRGENLTIVNQDISAATGRRAVRYYKIVPQYDGQESEGVMLMGVAVEQARYVVGNSVVRWILHDQLRERKIGLHFKNLAFNAHNDANGEKFPIEPIFMTKHIVLPPMEDDAADIKIEMRLLMDMRYNPFESAVNFPGGVCHADYEEETKRHSNFIYVPVAICYKPFGGGDGDVYVYVNNIPFEPVAPEKEMYRMSWTYQGHGAQWVRAGSCEDPARELSYLCYYNPDNRADDTGILGWKSNRQCIPPTLARLDTALAKSGEGQFIKYPPKSVQGARGGELWMTVVSSKWVLCDGGYNLAFDRDGIPSPWKRVTWVLCETPKIELVATTPLDREIEDEDVEYNGEINPDALDEMSIDTICGTKAGGIPTARGAYFDTDGDQITELIRAGRKGQVEDLLIGTLYSQYATRHTKISGEATIDTGGLALRREANQGDAVFIVTGETQNLKNCCGEITIVELSRDEYKRENE